MPKFKVTIKDIRQKIVSGKHGIGRNLHFHFASPSFTITHNKAHAGSKNYLLAGELPITAATPIELTVDIVEIDKIASDTGRGSIGFTLDPALGVTEQVLSVRVKEDYGPNSKKPDAPIVEFVITLACTVEQTNQEQNKERADKFVPLLNKALDSILPTVNGNCHLDRDDVFSLLLNTANHESDCFRRVAEYNGGKGEGVVQMIPATYDSLWDNYLNTSAHATTARALRQLAGIDSGRPDRGLMKTNNCYAAGMALVRYLDHGAGDEHPLPHVGDVQAQSEFWGAHYQTQSDPKKMREFRDHWQATFGAPSPAPAPGH